MAVRNEYIDENRVGVERTSTGDVKVYLDRDYVGLMFKRGDCGAFDVRHDLESSSTSGKFSYTRKVGYEAGETLLENIRRDFDGDAMQALYAAMCIYVGADPDEEDRDA